MVTVSLPLDEARFNALAARAAREGKPVESLLLDALDVVLDDEAAYIAAVKEGLADLDAGNTTDGDVVFDEVRALIAKMQR
jgi:predicted transcriptional regulator